jgi:hypothetical protein
MQAEYNFIGCDGCLNSLFIVVIIHNMLRNNIDFYFHRYYVDLEKSQCNLGTIVDKLEPFGLVKTFSLIFAYRMCATICLLLGRVNMLMALYISFLS